MHRESPRTVPTRAAVIRRYRRLIAAVQQIITDVESWNDNRLDCRPFDCGRDRVLKARLERELAEFITATGGEASHAP